MKILVLSSSSLHTFLDCRKAYDLTWHRGLEPLHASEAINNGTSFHAHAAAFADFYHHNDNEAWKKYLSENGNDQMLAVFREYRRLKWDVRPEQIMLSSAAATTREHPLYLPLVKTGGYDVWIRFTLDFVVKADTGWVDIIDYKTFSQYPSTQNSDLDFQGRGSIAQAMRYFETDQVQFKWKHVRSVVPGTPRGTGPWEFKWTQELTRASRKERAAIENLGYWYKIDSKGKEVKADIWTVDECYPPEGSPEAMPLVCNRSESDEMWLEMQDAAKDMVRAMKEGRWYRSPRRGTMPFTCHSCLAKHLCREELSVGRLDQESIDRLATVRMPLQVPDADLRRWKRRVPKIVVPAAA